LAKNSSSWSKKRKNFVKEPNLRLLNLCTTTYSASVVEG
jgi:hypothetical protein